MSTHTPLHPDAIAEDRERARTGPARILAVSNWKGGSGKSSTTIGLGYALAEAGFRVLLVDLDPQANLTDNLGIDPGEISVADIMLAGLYSFPDPPPTAEAIYATPYPGLFVLPAPSVQDPTHAELASAEVLISARDQLTGQRRLARGLALVRDSFDFILIDAPPQVGMLVINALCAADAVIVALRAERHALKGFASLSHLVGEVAENYNPNLRLAGAVMIADRRHVETRSALRQLERASIPLIGPLVPLSTAAPAQAQRRRMPLMAVFPDHAIARAYRRAARDLVEAM